MDKNRLNSFLSGYMKGVAKLVGQSMESLQNYLYLIPWSSRYRKRL